MNGFKRLRLLACKDISTVAKELGINTSTVYSWERNHFKPNPKKFKKMAAVYKCTIEALVEAYETQD